MSKGKSGKAKPPANRGEQQGAVSRRQAATPPLTAANRGEQQAAVSGGQAATAPRTQPRPVRKSAPERFWYVEVAAVRIQSWIARTPRLRFRRGASNLLIDVTSRARILPVVPVDAEWAPDAKWAPDAGEVSGVVTVQFSGLLSEERTRTAAVRLAGIIAAEMRASAPALEIQAGWGVGSSYLQAFPDIRRRVREHGPLLDIPAVMAEAVSAQPCQECRAAAAGHQILVTKQTLEVCVDCRSRAEWAGALGARTEEKLPKAQQDLAVRVAQQLPQGTVLARPCLDLTELANCAQHLARMTPRPSSRSSRPTGTVSGSGHGSGAVLIPAGLKHPWPYTVISSRFGSGRDRVRLTKVEPAVVAEVSVDTARQAKACIAMVSGIAVPTGAEAIRSATVTDSHKHASVSGGAG